MSSARYLAAELLCKTFRNGGYSNIQLGSALGSADMDERDKKFCTALYYGVIERRITSNMYWEILWREKTSCTVRYFSWRVA